MLSEKELTKQIARLTHLPFAPREPEDLKATVAEFRRVLRAGCRSDAHLSAVVDYLMDHSPRIPPPSEVAEACGLVRIGVSTDGLPAPCERCGDTAGCFAPGPRGYARCTCPRGLALSAMDERNPPHAA